MPYTTSSAPDYVTKDRAQWAAIWNRVYADTGSEQRAFQVANGVMLKALKSIYSPPPYASTDELKALWNRAFGAASNVVNDSKIAKRIANGTVKRIASDADGRKSPGSVVAGGRRAWNAVFNASRAAKLSKKESKRVANAVVSMRSYKAVSTAVLAVVRAAKAQGVL
jgi:hypothetical protein